MRKYEESYRLCGKKNKRSDDIENTSIMGGDRKRNKEAWNKTEIKMLWEKRHGNREPHITGQGSS